MNVPLMTTTIYSAIHAYIFRCPSCKVPDRSPSPCPQKVSCRFCNESFTLTETTDYNNEFLSISGQLTQWEYDGCPHNTFEKKSKGLAVEFHCDEDKKMLNIAAKLCGADSYDDYVIKYGQKMRREVIEEARMMRLMEKNPGLNKEQKTKLLKENGFLPFELDGLVMVFFASTYAPECDSYLKWKD
jgi:hypothetical protein